jgi:hypothetical protein
MSPLIPPVPVVLEIAPAPPDPPGPPAPDVYVLPDCDTLPAPELDRYQKIP